MDIDLQGMLKKKKQSESPPPAHFLLPSHPLSILAVDSSWQLQPLSLNDTVFFLWSILFCFRHCRAILYYGRREFQLGSLPTPTTCAYHFLLPTVHHSFSQINTLLASFYLQAFCPGLGRLSREDHLHTSLWRMPAFWKSLPRWSAGVRGLCQYLLCNFSLPFSLSTAGCYATESLQESDPQSSLQRINLHPLPELEQLQGWDLSRLPPCLALTLPCPTSRGIWGYEGLRFSGGSAMSCFLAFPPGRSGVSFPGLLIGYLLSVYFLASNILLQLFSLTLFVLVSLCLNEIKFPVLLQQ